MKIYYFLWVFLLSGFSLVGQVVPDTIWAGKLVKEAIVFAKARKYEESLTKLDTAGEIYLKTVGEVSEQYGNVLHLRGFALQGLNRLDTSINLYQQSIMIRQELLGIENIEVAKSYNNLGLCYYYTIQYSKAVEAFEKSIAIKIKILGTEDLSVANSYQSIGACFSPMGEYNNAFDFYQKSLKIKLKSLGSEHPDVATLYNNIGAVLSNMGKNDSSITFHNKALNIRVKLFGEHSLEVSECYASLGIPFSNTGEFDQALQCFMRALKTQIMILDEKSIEVANSYNNIGSVFKYKQDYDKAIVYFEKSIEIQTSIFEPKHPFLAHSYINLGTCFMSKGDTEQSIEMYNKALKILKALFVDNHPDIATCYSNLTECYEMMGDYFRVIEFSHKALDIGMKSLGENHPDIIRYCNNLGAAYLNVREYEKAIYYYNKSLYLYLKHPSDKIALAHIYDGLGDCFQVKEDYEQAIKFHKDAVEIGASILGDENSILIRPLDNLGICYSAIKDYDKAYNCFKKCLDINLKAHGLKHPGSAMTYRGMAYFLFKKGEYEQALEYCLKALYANNYIKNRPEMSLSPLELSKTQSTMGKINLFQFKQTGDIKYIHNAGPEFQSARQSSRFQRIQVTGDKKILDEGICEIYEGSVFSNVCLYHHTDSLHYLQEAFAASEESRSLSLYESLRESDALHFAGIPDSLLQREYDLRVDIAYYDKKRFEEEIEKKKPITDSTLLAINSKLFDLKRAYEALKDTFEQQYPDYYRLKYDLQVESVENVQQSLPPDQALLEYFVGDSSIFIFLVKKNDYRAIEVKKDFPLEDWVKQLRHGIYGYHTADPNRKTDDLRDSCANEYIESATALYQKLLAPVDSLLPRRVVIVPDGALGYIPFEALLTDRPKRANRFHEYPYFGGQTGTAHSISYCYSATLLREMTTRQHRQTPGKSFLAYAPYYDGDTTLLASRSIDPNNPANRLPPLKYATEEVEALHGIMGGKAVIGRSARKDSLIQEAGQYRIVHLSTHGKANDKVGDYSFLAFSEVKDSVDNEWLYVRDIYNLSLNADMVVLSACETGIGELKRGEGIISLARAFAYAGAKSIVTTLWSVDDAKTKDLMVFFYRHLKQGMTKDEALAKARSDYFEKYKSGDAHPFFWAGFIGIGDMGAFQ